MHAQICTYLPYGRLTNVYCAVSPIITISNRVSRVARAQQLHSFKILLIPSFILPMVCTKISTVSHEGLCTQNMSSTGTYPNSPDLSSTTVTSVFCSSYSMVCCLHLGALPKWRPPSFRSCERQRKQNGVAQAQQFMWLLLFSLLFAVPHCGHGQRRLFQRIGPTCSSTPSGTWPSIRL